MVDQTGASRQRRRDLVDGQDVSEQATAQARPRTRATKKPIATMAQFTSWQQWRGQKCPRQWCGGATAKEKMVRTGDVWQKIWSRHHCGQCKWGPVLLVLCCVCCRRLTFVVFCCSLLFFVVLCCSCCSLLFLENRPIFITQIGWRQGHMEVLLILKLGWPGTHEKGGSKWSEGGRARHVHICVVDQEILYMRALLRRS